MVEYSCEKCGKKFNRKSNYIAHRDNKKYPCLPQMLKIPSFMRENEESSLINEGILSNQDHNKNKIKENKSIKDYKCKYCNSSFTRKDNLQRHLKDNCNDNNNKKEIDSLKEMIIMLTNEVQNLKNKNEDLIKTNKTVKNSNNVTKTINSNNNLNSNNNINQTINIVQFGKEDIKNLDIKEAMNVYLKSTGGNIIANMLKYINFNSNHPENFNICMTDLAREIVKIYDGSKFVSKKFKNVQEQIISNVSTNIYELCDKFVEDENIKKTRDILQKININNISLKLINNDDIEDLVKEQDILNNVKKLKCNSSESEELTVEQTKKIEFYENKKLGLQEITNEKIRDELYNNRNLFEQKID